MPSTNIQKVANAINPNNSLEVALKDFLYTIFDVDGNITSGKTINGTTISGGNITNVDGSTVLINTNWGVDSNGVLVPTTDNTYDIGSTTSSAQNIYSSTGIIKKGNAIISTSEGYGLYSIKSISALGTATAATTFTIATQVPSGAKILGTQLRVDVALTSSDGGTTWGAAFNTGSTTSLGTGKAFAKNTKVNLLYDENGATAVTSAATNITITADSAKTFAAGGKIVAVVYYAILTTMTDKS